VISFTLVIAPMLVALSHGPAAALAAEEIASHGHSHAIADDGVFPGTMQPITNTSSRSFPVAAMDLASLGQTPQFPGRLPCARAPSATDRDDLPASPEPPKHRARRSPRP
jgi:hypothetical protein